MRDILKDLYNGNVDAVNQKLSNEYMKASKKEIELYKKLKDQLPTELCELFDEYIQVNDNVTELLALERYKLGFKTGLQMGIECNKR